MNIIPTPSAGWYVLEAEHIDGVIVIREVPVIALGVDMSLGDNETIWPVVSDTAWQLLGRTPDGVQRSTSSARRYSVTIFHPQIAPAYAPDALAEAELLREALGLEQMPAVAWAGEQRFINDPKHHAVR